MTDEVPATAKDIQTEANTTNAEDVEEDFKGRLSDLNTRHEVFKKQLDELKPVSPAKAFSGGAPEHHPTPITKRVLRDIGFHPTTTNIWSRGDCHIQLNDVSNTWSLLSTNKVVNFIEDLGL